MNLHATKMSFSNHYHNIDIRLKILVRTLIIWFIFKISCESTGNSLVSRPPWRYEDFRFGGGSDCTSKTGKGGNLIILASVDTMITCCCITWHAVLNKCLTEEIFYSYGKDLQNIFPCSVCTTFGRIRSLYHTCCDTGPRVLQSHPIEGPPYLVIM
jgi:hypothetical protein